MSALSHLHDDFQELLSILAAQPSLQTVADDCFRKVLLLSAASYFERTVTETIVSFVQNVTSQNECVTEFVRRKGLTRQYHTLFAWDAENPVKGATQFFAFFGEGFKAAMKARLSADPELEAAVAAFIEVGRDRNRLIHQDLASFTLEKTAAEIFAQYTRALRFVETLPKLLASGGLEA